MKLCELPQKEPSKFHKGHKKFKKSCGSFYHSMEVVESNPTSIEVVEASVQVIEAAL